MLKFNGVKDLGSILLEQALNLLMYGLSTVFVFLCLLVLLTSFMSQLVLSFGSREHEGTTNLNKVKAAKGAAIKFHNKKT